MATSAPDISPVLVIATGATELRDVFTADQLPGILIAYMHGLKTAFIVCIAVVGITAPITFLGKWNRLNTAALTGAVVA
jgi:MFS transporter, DHA2 family, glioxin efflux transporter